MRPAKYSRARRTDRSVSRPYGGVLSHQEVRQRITRRARGLPRSEKRVDVSCLLHCELTFRGLYGLQGSTYKRRASYRTKSNRFRKVKTPGGKLAIQYVQEKSLLRDQIKPLQKGEDPWWQARDSVHQKEDLWNKMPGVKVMRPAKYSRARRTDRSVSRPYGGVLSHQEVRQRITRAFMIEELNSIK